MNLNLEGLNPIHFLLAYAGMMIHVLMKLAEVFNRPDFKFKTFFLTNVISVLISIIGIPMLLIIATDPSIKSVLPINYVTSMLAGWQTQSLFKTLFSLYGGPKPDNSIDQGVVNQNPPDSQKG